MYMYIDMILIINIYYITIYNYIHCILTSCGIQTQTMGRYGHYI